LRQAVVHERMEPREAGQGRHVLVDFGVVLHCARAQGVEASIHAEIALREVGVMAHQLDLADLWQWSGLAPQRLRGQQRVQRLLGDVQRRKGCGTAPRRALLEDQMLTAHASSLTISSRVTASASMSSRVRVSVTQKSAAFPSSGYARL